MMKRLLGLLMVVGLMVNVVGCDVDISGLGTGPEYQGQPLELDTEKWSNGNIKVEFQFYRNGNEIIIHGSYKEYYENGQIRSEGNFSNGKAHDNSSLAKIVVLRSDSIEEALHNRLEMPPFTGHLTGGAQDGLSMFGSMLSNDIGQG